MGAVLSCGASSVSLRVGGAVVVSQCRVYAQSCSVGAVLSCGASSVSLRVGGAVVVSQCCVYAQSCSVQCCLVVLC